MLLCTQIRLGIVTQFAFQDIYKRSKKYKITHTSRRGPIECPKAHDSERRTVVVRMKPRGRPRFLPIGLPLWSERAGPARSGLSIRMWFSTRARRTRQPVITDLYCLDDTLYAE